MLFDSTYIYVNREENVTLIVVLFLIIIINPEKDNQKNLNNLLQTNHLTVNLAMQ